MYDVQNQFCAGEGGGFLAFSNWLSKAGEVKWAINLVCPWAHSETAFPSPAGWRGHVQRACPANCQEVQ